MRIGNGVRSYARAATSVVMATALAFGLSLVLGTVETSAAVEGVVAPAASEGVVAPDGESAAGHGDLAGADSSSEGAAPAASQINRVLSLTALSGSDADAGIPLVADVLAGKPTNFVNQAVSLAGDTVVLGSFVVDGMTYAVTGEGTVELVAVGPEVLAAGVHEVPEGEFSGSPSAEDASSVALLSDVAEQASSGMASPQPSSEGAPFGGSDPAALEVPASVEHDGMAYAVASIGPRAFVGSDAVMAVVPVTVEAVDSEAFQGSAVEAVEVAEGNPHFSSYEGVLYDADQTSLLLIPESKQGVVRIPKTVDAVPSDAFARCSGVTAIEVDAGNAAFYSEDGCLYSSERLICAPIGGQGIGSFANTHEEAVGYWESDKGHTEPSQARGADTLGTERELKDTHADFRADFWNAQLVDVTPSPNTVTQDTFSNSDRVCHWYGVELPLVITASLTWNKNSVGYRGWSTNSSSGPVDYAFGEPIELTSDRLEYTKVLWAVRGKESCSVSFDANGGAGGQTASVTAKWKESMPPISSSKPTRAGYTFGGWYDVAGSSGGTQYYTSECISARDWDKNDDATLYARWTPNRYTVSFNANGGSGGQSANVTATYGSAMPTISTTKPTRTGYTFQGWYDTSAASGGTQYYTAACASARTWNKTSNTTLYARWTPNRYTVSFNANGGSGGQSANVTATYDANMPGISTTKPTRTGYAFGGWYDTSAATGGTQYYTAACASARTWNKTSNATLYARWTAITYSVRYFDKAGNHIGTDQKAYDAWFNLRGDPGRTHPAYTAKGWARSANQTSASHAFALWTHNLASAQGATFDLYLAEEANRYSISYDLAGGELSGQPTGYTFETPDLRLPEPARTGYTFTGWKVTGAAAGSAGIAVDGVRSTVKQGTWGNLSCTATWRANQYAVALDAAFPAFAMGDVYEGYAPYGVSKDAGTASVTATFDAAMPAATMPHATGYAFEGYFDDAGTKYYDADGSSARTWDKPSNATLHGRWTLERHELTLDVGNGEVPSAAGRGWKRDTGDSGLYRLSYSIEWVEESGGSLRIQLPAPATKPGYASFDGWTGPNLTKPSKSVQVQPWELADRDYVGAFSSPVGYSATLDLAGGSFADAPEGWGESGGSWMRGFTVESDAFDLPVPSRAGHDFSGWALVGADGSLGSPAASVTVPKGTVGDLGYRAVWQARSYSITWDYSGQSIDGQQSATSSQAYGQAIAFPGRPSVADPAREHYAFEGWFTEREGGERVEAGDYLLERDATFYARWRPIEYTVHLHLGDDDAYAQHAAHIEKDGQALPLAPDGHYDLPYTVEGEVRLPMVTDDPSVPKPVREGMDFKGWVECGPDGSFDADAVPQPEVVLPAGSHGERHYRAVWSVALRFEAPSAVSFRLDLADDAAFADAPYGPVAKVEGEGVELRSLSAGPLAVADVVVDVAGADPDSIVTDRSKVQLRVMDATLPDPWAGWVPLPTTPVPERVDPYDLASLGFGDGNALAPLASKPLRYEIEVQDPTTTLAGEVDLPLARIVLTVKGLW